MIQSKAFITGVIGVFTFILTTIIAGLFYPNYSHTTQFISELYAVDAPNADSIRYCFYLPSGVALFLFGVFALQETPKSILGTFGFLGIGMAYGLGTVICAIFNCDAHCNPDFISPSISQIIHNFAGFLTYLIVPFSILFVAIAVRKWKNAASLSVLSFVIAAVCFVFFVFLNAAPFKGLIQRIIEGSILLWIISCAVYIHKNKRNATNQ